MKQYLTGRARAGLWFGLAALLTVGAGRWAQGLFLTSEFVHFSANFPAGENAQVSSRQAIGGPWAMLPDQDWDGYPPGGLLVWGREGRIVADMGAQGVIKNLIQPGDLTLSTHWLRNVGVRPYRLQLDFDMCGLPVEWETFERRWDPSARATTREVPVRGLFNMDWHVTVPADRFNRPVICAGGLRVRDADTGALLTDLPIIIVNSRAAAGESR